MSSIIAVSRGVKSQFFMNSTISSYGSPVPAQKLIRSGSRFGDEDRDWRLL